MSFLNKFQYHYHGKNLDKLFANENYPDLFSYLEKLNKEKKLFHDLSFKYVNLAINNSSQDISKKQIIWINSFLKKDYEYIVSFMEEYLSNFKPLAQTIRTYQDEINDILLKSEKIDLNTLINHSYFFQWMILNNQISTYKFISNSIPFFSTDNNFNFSKANITRAYILVISHPYDVYKFIKKYNNNDQEVARNIFLNLDQKAFNQNFNNSSFYISKKGWHINTQSWTDANVINSLKGKIISKKELQKNTYEVLSSIILHLIQSGVELELDYDLIDNFVKKTPFVSDEISDDISTKEKKFLDKYISNIIDNYEDL